MITCNSKTCQHIGWNFVYKYICLLENINICQRKCRDYKRASKELREDKNKKCGYELF